MKTNLQELLLREEPCHLREIERAIRKESVRDETLEALLSALTWIRCTSGSQGIIGSITNADCAARVRVLALHLKLVGAVEAAKAFEVLRDSIDLPDEKIQNALIDWLDTQPAVWRTARALDPCIQYTQEKIWNFMRQNIGALPKLEFRTGLFGFF